MLNNLKSFALGIRDGWNQPYILGTSYNVDHLASDHNDAVYEMLDRGINIGQFIRSGTNSEAWVEGYWPFKR